MTGAVPSWEKQGPTAWAQCPRCGGWFPVAVALMALRTIELCCPMCSGAFKPEAARDTMLP